MSVVPQGKGGRASARPTTEEAVKVTLPTHQGGFLLTQDPTTAAKLSLGHQIWGASGSHPLDTMTDGPETDIYRLASIC